MTIRTLILSGLVVAFAAPALAGDGHEAQKNVYDGLRPAQTFTTPLESRVAIQRDTLKVEDQANIRIQQQFSDRAMRGYGN